MRAAGAQLSSFELASALAVPHPTVRRWLAAWLELEVPGVVRVPIPTGRHKSRYVVHPSLVGRWLRGELPAPRSPRPA